MIKSKTTIVNQLKLSAPRAELRWNQGHDYSMWGLRSAVCHFLNFSNQTIIKGDILRNVKQNQKFYFLQIFPLKSVIEKL